VVTRGPGHTTKQVLNLLHLRGKAAVEPNHYQRRRSSFELRPLDRLEFGKGQAQRLLDENMLAARERLQHEACVAVVAGCDHYSVHVRIGY
jgi:hypothetical protein